jgi:hypothetical protein
MPGRNRLRIFAAPSDTRRMSSASLRNFAICAPSAPKPLTTRMPDTDSSTTLASSACSACTARTAGWIALLKRRASRLTNGSGSSATSASIGWLKARITTTPRICMTFDNVSGIMTTNA